MATSHYPLRRGKELLGSPATNVSMYGIQFDTSCCYIRQTSGQVLGCHEQLFWERHTYDLHMFANRLIG